ncbi:MAG TPA: YkgJ family cysteine cluster protein [Planctomycetota bacterium]|nr:YkgJ family cysteine cluster protein [Planctomycetota bacterium]
MSDAGTKPGRQPWYAEGLRFTCLPDCGKCCTRHGAYGYVYLEEGDAERLASQLGLDAATFRRTYTAKDDGHLVLRMDEPACPFLEGSRCRVYEARPTQCRTFPFWPENLRSRVRWERLREFCPGIGEGEVHPLHVIRSRSRDGA